MLRACLLLIAAALTACGPRLARLPETTNLDMAASARSARLAHAARSLQGSMPQGVRPTVVLSKRTGLGAWAYRAGRIEVTLGLVDLLDDDELAAVVAHELGHLVAGRPRGEPSALAEVAEDADELQADAVACRLLAASGRPPAALPRMLRRLGAAMPGCDFGARVRAAASGPCAAP